MTTAKARPAAQATATAFSHGEFAAWLHGCIEADVAGLVLAPPGVGKTATIRQVAAMARRPLVTIEGAFVTDETALMGLPFAVDGRTRYLPPESLVLPDNAILFIDEITSSTCQAPLYALLLEKRIDTRQLGKGVRIIAAGNREEDAGSRWSLSPVVTNRVSLLTEYAGPTAREWINYAASSLFNPATIAAIEYAPQFLHAYNPDRLRNPTPRTWELASKLIDGGMGVQLALTTTVGSEAAAATEIVAAHYNQMVSSAQILSGKAKRVTDPIISNLTLANLSRHLGQATVGEARKAVAWVDAQIDFHGAAAAAIAVRGMASANGITALPEYQAMVNKYARHL